eukprot:3704362-Pyramimonas_sp.AAC.1
MDNPNRVNVAIARATAHVVIIVDGRMFSTAAGSHLRELSEYGRIARLWVRFQGSDMGNRTALHCDQGFDPIKDLE